MNFYINGVPQNAGHPYDGVLGPVEDRYQFLLGAANVQNEEYVNISQQVGFRDVRIYRKDVTEGIADWMVGNQLGGEIAWWNLPSLIAFGETSYSLTAVGL